MRYKQMKPSPGSALRFLAVLLLAAPAVLFAQTRVPLLGAATTPAPEPTTPAASSFHDARYGVSFRSPAGWNLTRRDAELSTFAFDVRTAPVSAQMRGLVTIAFNPHPTSTFTGALFYFCVTPHSTEIACLYH